MSVQSKYQSVLDLGEKLGAKDGEVKEENGVLHIKGTVHSQYEKNQLWDAIKAIGGAQPADIAADIKVETNDYYAKYTVVKGDTLGKISKHFYEEAGKYMQIFNANRDILSNPDLIQVGQVLTIPFEQ
ncbi:MAG: LysM peptidoglycan-binding domain-containing protein [Lewinellaceae bacterium]|nr:LysM peptidoglycan-binding domain-containing protein [Lewinellaceae bacterium]